MNSSPSPVTIGAYVYPGWHACAERDRHFPQGWNEWNLVLNAKPCFSGHNQPRIPLHGVYDDSDPVTAQRQVRLAREFGVDFFIYGFFWSRGKRVFDAALDKGFVGKDGGGDFPSSDSLNPAPDMMADFKTAGFDSYLTMSPGNLLRQDPIPSPFRFPA